MPFSFNVSGSQGLSGPELSPVTGQELSYCLSVGRSVRRYPGAKCLPPVLLLLQNLEVLLGAGVGSGERPMPRLRIWEMPPQPPGDSQQQAPAPTGAACDPTRVHPGSPAAAAARALNAQLYHQQQGGHGAVHHLILARQPRTPPGTCAPTSGSPPPLACSPAAYISQKAAGAARHLLLPVALATAAAPSTGDKGRGQRFLGVKVLKAFGEDPNRRALR